MAAQSIQVTQLHNREFDSKKPAGDLINPTYVYQVNRTVNTMVVHIGDYLVPGKILDLIASGINVTINEVK